MKLQTKATLYAVATLVGIAVGACEREGTGDTRIALTCADYCRQAADCDDEVDVDECKDDCKNTMEDCMDDEQEEALDDLDECSEDSCDDFLGCTIGAGLECSFGI